MRWRWGEQSLVKAARGVNGRCARVGDEIVPSIEPFGSCDEPARVVRVERRVGGAGTAVTAEAIQHALPDARHAHVVRGPVPADRPLGLEVLDDALERRGIAGAVGRDDIPHERVVPRHRAPR